MAASTSTRSRTSARSRAATPRGTPTVTRNGKRYVLVEESEYRALAASRERPDVAAADEAGMVPAVAYARASLARKIILGRAEAGLTQADLARRAGLRVETLNRIEKGKVTPDTASIVKIDRALRAARRSSGASARG